MAWYDEAVFYHIYPLGLTGAPRENYTGRDFFAFQDLKRNRENSAYRDWFCNVNFWGNNEYNDGFTYENWGGYNLLVKLNQKNPAVKDYICDVIRFWVKEYGIDGIRLDAADVLDFEYMKALRHVANEVKPEFWLMGEVIHGDYTRWVNEGTLHSVTNYHLHKALYSGHNDHNYFEIAHTVKCQCDMGGLKLYNFVDNHDVERIYTKLSNKAHYTPTHILLYTLPGIPSVYYGSEFGIEGRKEYGSDASLRPVLSYDAYKDAVENNKYTRQYAFARNYQGQTIVVTVNNDDNDFTMNVAAGNASAYKGALSGETVRVQDGRITVNVKANSGEIWLPEEVEIDLGEVVLEEVVAPVKEELVKVNKSYEEMTIEELQEAILDKMRKNGPITPQMLKDVRENVYHNSPLTWVRSFW